MQIKIVYPIVTEFWASIFNIVESHVTYEEESTVLPQEPELYAAHEVMEQPTVLLKKISQVAAVSDGIN